MADWLTPRKWKVEAQKKNLRVTVAVKYSFISKTQLWAAAGENICCPLAAVLKCGRVGQKEWQHFSVSQLATAGLCRRRSLSSNCWTLKRGAARFISFFLFVPSLRPSIRRSELSDSASAAATITTTTSNNQEFFLTPPSATSINSRVLCCLVQNRGSRCFHTFCSALFFLLLFLSLPLPSCQSRVHNDSHHRRQQKPIIKCSGIAPPSVQNRTFWNIHVGRVCILRVCAAFSLLPPTLLWTRVAQRSRRGHFSLVCQTGWYLEPRTLGQKGKTQSAPWFHNPAGWRGLFYRPCWFILINGGCPASPLLTLSPPPYCEIQPQRPSSTQSPTGPTAGGTRGGGRVGCRGAFFFFFVSPLWVKGGVWWESCCSIPREEPGSEFLTQLFPKQQEYQSFIPPKKQEWATN